MHKLSHYWGWILAVLMTLAGFGLRLYDLTDQPLDFHSTRQLRGALIARNFYYQSLPDTDAVIQADPGIKALTRKLSSATGQYEPPVLERLVAWSYRLMGGENLWVSRLWTSSFWCIGGLFLYYLARKMAGDPAALVSLGFYLFLPFAVQASRSFQPDPGMVMWIIIAVTLLYRWSESVLESEGTRREWTLAVIAGLAGGVAVLSKAVAIYIVGAAAMALVLSTLGRKSWRNGQAWTMAALLLVPSLLFYILGREARAAGYLQSWTISLSHLLLDPQVYFRWFNLVVSLMGLFPLILSLFGIALGGKADTPGITNELAGSSRSRSFLVGLWVGYLIYGLTLPYQMYTHNYYHLQLVPIIALSIAPVFQALYHTIQGQESREIARKFWKVVASLGLVIAAIYWAMLSVINFRAEDFRAVPAHWEEIGAHVPAKGSIIGLTQDYGFPLSYYGWRKVTLWPILAEQQLAAMRGREKGFEDLFNKRTEGKEYFLVTSFNQLEKQPDLGIHLEERFPVYAEGSGFIIYDLTHPLQPDP